MIQIQRGKSIYVYKINEFNNRQIVTRQNKHGARWDHYETYDTPEQATAALLALRSGREDEGDATR